MTKLVKLANLDFIAMALNELDAVGRFVDVEDMFIWCYEASPERFRWRKYDCPNYNHALVAFEQKYPDYLIRTRDGLSRQFTAEGYKWISRRIPTIQRVLSLLKTLERY